MPLPSRLRRPVAAALIAAMTCGGLAPLTPAAAADSHARLPALAEAAGGDIARLIAQAGGRADPADAAGERMGDSLADLFERLADKAPHAVPRLPAAIAQAAHLALTAENPATRAMMADFAREGVAEAVSVTGMDAQTHPVLAAWSEADPALRSGEGLEVTAADAADFDRLTRRAGYQGELSATAFWDSKEAALQDRVQPARLNAWVAGAEAAWDDLSDDQRRVAASVLDVEALPPEDLVKKITGTRDFAGWLGGVAIPMTKAERKASPELVRYLENGAFAGPLIQLLALRSGRGGAVSVGIGGGAVGQLQRLNNWSAMTGEMSSWESYRYSTQGW